MSKAQNTHNRLRSVALELFGEHGYQATTTTRIAAAAGVSEMTLFRHFRTKEALLLEDLLDPMLAAAVLARPVTEAPLLALARGIQDAWSAAAPDELPRLKQVLQVIAGTPGLSGAIERNNSATTAALAAALQERGATELAAQAAAAAVVAALGTALLLWARSGQDDPSPWIEAALQLFEGV